MQFDQSSPVQPVSDFRGGSTSVTEQKKKKEIWIRHMDFRAPFVTLRGPPLDAETGWTGDLLLKTSLRKSSLLVLFRQKNIYFQNFEIFAKLIFSPEIYNVKKNLPTFYFAKKKILHK